MRRSRPSAWVRTVPAPIAARGSSYTDGPLQDLGILDAVAAAPLVGLVGAGDSVPVEEEAEMAVDGDGVARLEIDGLGETGGVRERNPAFPSGVVDWPAPPSQADHSPPENHR